MFLLHCYATAATAHEFRCSYFIFALVSVICFGGATERAFGLIATRIAQMPGFVGNRSAVFTSVGHCNLLIKDTLKWISKLGCTRCPVYR